MAGGPNKGMHFPPDPPQPEEIILVTRQAGNGRHGLRVRALIAVLWRGGLRISEALALGENDVDERRGSLLIRHGKGDKRRAAGMDDWGFEQLCAWLQHRILLPVGPLFCVIDGPSRGRAWAPSAARGELRRLAVRAGVRRRFAPHQPATPTVELAREGVAVNIIQRQLGQHTDLGTTSTYLQGSTQARSSRQSVLADSRRSQPPPAPRSSPRPTGAVRTPWRAGDRRRWVLPAPATSAPGLRPPGGAVRFRVPGRRQRRTLAVVWGCSRILCAAALAGAYTTANVPAEPAAGRECRVGRGARRERRQAARRPAAGRSSRLQTVIVAWIRATREASWT